MPQVQVQVQQQLQQQQLQYQQQIQQIQLQQLQLQQQQQQLQQQLQQAQQASQQLQTHVSDTLCKTYNGSLIHCLLLFLLPGLEFLVEYCSRYSNSLLCTNLSLLYVIYQTRATVFHRDIKTPRRELKIRRAAEYF